MKILIVNTVRFKRNGITVHILNYYRKLQGYNVQIDFVAGSDVDPEIKNEINYDKSKFYELKTRNTKTCKYIIELYKIIRKNKYDIVHVHGNSCLMAVDLLAAKLARCQVRIAHVHSTSCSHKKLNMILRPLFNMVCSYKFACSESAGKWLYKNETFTVIKNGLDIQHFLYSEEDRVHLRSELGISENEKIIGHIGIFNDSKNHEMIVEIFYRYQIRASKAKLLLIGEGDDKPKIENLVKELGIKDKVIFYDETNKISALLSAMDLFLFPSKYEGLGMAFIEAQISGMPCIASENVPAVSKVGHRTAYLNLNDPVEKWVEFIERALSETQYQRSNYYKENYLLVQQYDIEHLARHLIMLYTELSRANI